ncbi:phage tail protein, partial [Escherichia sp. MOD1-EC6096]
VLRALSAVGVPAAIKEWWQDSPRKKPYTFRVELFLREGADSVLYSRVRTLVIKAKNLRSGLSTIDVNTNIGKDSQFYVGGAVTAHIDVVIEAGE